MALYEITGPDGAIYEIEGPEGVTEEQLLGAVRRQIRRQERDEERAQLQAQADETFKPIERAVPEGDAGFIENVLSGLGAGAAGLYEYAALGAATALNEGDETEARRIIQEAADSITPEGGDKDSITYQIAQGVGSILGLAPAAILGPLGIIPAGAVAMAAGAGEASERAREEDATEEERSTAALKGVGIGATEIIPLGRVFKAFKMPFLQDLIDKVGPEAVRDGGSRIANAAATGGVEAAQETAAELLQNLTERGYNPNQEIVEGLAGAAGIGGASGAIVDLMVNAFVKKGSKGTPEPSDELLALPPPTPDTLDQPVTLPDGSVATTREEVAAFERRRAEREQAPKLEQLDRMVSVTFKDGSTDTIPLSKALQSEDVGVRRQANDLQNIFATEERAQTEATRRMETARQAETETAQRDKALGQTILALRDQERGIAQQELDRLDQLETAEIEAMLADDQRRAELVTKIGERNVAELERARGIGPQLQAREAEAAQQRREAQRIASEAETATGAEITARQQETTQRREQVLQDIIAADPKQVPDIRGTFQAVLEAGNQPTELTATEDRLIKRAEDARVADFDTPRQIPSTPEDTQLTELEAAIPARRPREEQLALEGIPSRRQEKRAQRRPATITRDVERTPELPRREVTPDLLDQLAIPPTAPIRRRTLGKNFNDPAVREDFAMFAGLPRTSATARSNINRELADAPAEQLDLLGPRGGAPRVPRAVPARAKEAVQDVESRQPEPEPSGVSVPASEPSPRGRPTTPKPPRAARVEAPKPERLESVERDVADAKDREGTERTALEEKPKAKAKRARRKTAEVLQTVKPLPKAKTKATTKAKTETPPPPPPRKVPAGEKSTTTPEEVKTKTTTRQTPAGRVAMRVASKAEQDLRKAHEDKNPLVGNTFFEFVFAKTGDSKATDADKTAVAKLIRKTADTAKSKQSSKTPNNAARIYFGKHSTIESSIELIASDYVFPIGDKQQSAYQKISDADLTPEQRKELGAFAAFNDETQANEDAYMQGQGNHFTANAARTWVLAHLSPEMKQLMADRIQYYTSMQEALNRKEDNERRRADPDRKKALARLRRMRKRAELANDFVELNKAEAYAYGLKPSEELLSNDQIEEAILQARETERAERRAESQDMRGLDISVEGQDWLDSLLPSDAVSATAAPLHPSVIAAMDTGITAKALQFLAATTSNNQVRNAARKLIKHIGTTKIKVVDKLGPNESGKFNPKTNTITLSAESGMNAHTLLHETAHAVTSAAIADPKLPVTKQLTKLFESVKDQLDTAYGATNLDEFVAEAFSNPEFRMKLAGLTPKGDQFTALERFTNAVMNLLRRLVGMQTKPLGTALSEADALIEEILAPAPESRNAGELLLISKAGPQAVADFANGYGTSLKNSAQAVKDAVSRDKFADNAANFLLRSGGKFADTLRGIALMTLPSQAFLTDVLGKLKVKAGAKLHELFQNQEADINLANRQLDGVLTQLQNWQKGKPEQTDIFNKVVHNSTIEQVDPTKSKDKYEGKETQYDAVKALYDQLDPEGKRLYVELRDTYKKLYQRMQDVLNRRIDNMVDEAGDPIADSEKRTLKEKVFGKLFEQGRIEPYFPLVRRGDYWLEYDIESVGIDGEKTTERVVRAFETKGQRQTAIAQLKEMPEVITKDGEPVFETNDDKNKVNFRNAPPVSFVGQTLKILNKNNISKEVQQEFINLFIDTLPEASFAKSLRKREGTLGFEEDAVLAFRTKAYDVARQTVRLEYTQKINAQVRGIENEIDEDRDLKGTSLATVLKEEVSKRGEFATNPPNDVFARAAQQANRLAFLGTIGFNISSAIVNMSQIPAVVLPFMAGKTSFAKATGNLNTARKFFAGAGSESSIIVNGKQVKTRNKLRIPSIDNYYTVAEDGTLSLRDDLELSDEKNINVHGKDVSQKELAEIMLPLVQEAMNQGQLNHSLFFDTQGLEQSGKVKYVGDGLFKKTMRGLETFNVISATPFHTAERFNRQVTLTATYLNELQRLNEANEKLPANQKLSPSEIEAEAVRESLYETQQTNGGAVLATAPRIAQKHIGRVAMMYKTFGIQMYYTQMKTALSALESSGLDAEQRRIAKRQIIATQLSVLMLSGVQGVTIYGMAAAIANMFLDDDEPDAETLTRTFLGEGLYKGGVNQLLALAGAEVDVASRIGLSNLILQTNRYNFDPSMEKTIVQTLGGPFYGYASQITRGVGDLMDGEVQRGVENILPAAFRNMSKTLFRYGDEGVLTRRKDPIMDDIGPSELAAQFFGFAPAEYTLNQERNQILKKIEKSVNTTRTKLLRQYYIALRTGDREGITEVREEMMKFNRRHPTSAITVDSIKRSMKQHMKTSATMYNGVTLSPNMRNQLIALGKDFE